MQAYAIWIAEKLFCRFFNNKGLGGLEDEFTDYFRVLRLILRYSYEVERARLFESRSIGKKIAEAMLLICTTGSPCWSLSITIKGPKLSLRLIARAILQLENTVHSKTLCLCHVALANAAIFANSQKCEHSRQMGCLLDAPVHGKGKTEKRIDYLSHCFYKIIL